MISMRNVSADENHCEECIGQNARTRVAERSLSPYDRNAQISTLIPGTFPGQWILTNDCDRRISFACRLLDNAGQCAAMTEVILNAARLIAPPEQRMVGGHDERAAFETVGDEL